jgi:hypothetical protein
MTNFRFLSTLLAVLTVAALVGCSGSPSSLQTPAAAAINVSSPVTSVQAGGTVQLTGTVSNASNSSVVWTVNQLPGGNSVVGTISGSGLYSAPVVAPVPATVTITGAAAANTSANQSIALTITSPPLPVTVTISPKTMTVQAGMQQPFTATVGNSTDTSVIWQVAGVQGGNPTVGMISASGVYTAPSVVPSPPTVTVTAVSHADPTATDSATVTISAAQPVVVSITPSNIDLQVGPGHTGQFSAMVTNTTNTAVTWQVQGITGGDATTVGAISSSGLYTAPNAVPTTNPVVISAVSAADPTVSGTATATLFFGPPPVTISIVPMAASVNVNNQQQFTAIVSNATDTSVKWDVNGIPNGNLSTVGMIDNAGLYTAPAAIPNPASVTVTATSNADPTKSASATVIIQLAVTVSVSPIATTVIEGQTAQFAAQVSNISPTTVQWGFLDPTCTAATCGTITPLMTTTNGVPVTYTAPGTLPSNPITVAATSLADPTKIGSATVIVTVVPVPSVSISPGPTVTIAHGGAPVPFNAMVFNDPSNSGVTWALTCTADDADDLDCAADNDGDLDNNSISGQGPFSVMFTPAKVIIQNPYTLTLSATTVATDKNGNHGVQIVTITVN